MYRRRSRISSYFEKYSSSIKLNFVEQMVLDIRYHEYGICIFIDIRSAWNHSFRQKSSTVFKLALILTPFYNGCKGLDEWKNIKTGKISNFRPKHQQTLILKYTLIWKCNWIVLVGGKSINHQSIGYDPYMPNCAFIWLNRNCDLAGM